MCALMLTYSCSTPMCALVLIYSCITPMCALVLTNNLKCLINSVVLNSHKMLMKHNFLVERVS